MEQRTITITELLPIFVLLIGGVITWASYGASGHVPLAPIFGAFTSVGILVFTLLAIFLGHKKGKAHRNEVFYWSNVVLLLLCLSIGGYLWYFIL